jgi:la-related protein 1
MWKAFILPEQERVDEAKHDGPKSFTAVRPSYPLTMYGGPAAHPGFHAPLPAGMFPSFPEEQMYQAGYVNGATHFDLSANRVAINGHRYGHETQLTAGVPEYSPPMSPLTLESMTNFSDAQVQNVVVILSYDEKDTPGSPEDAGVAGYVSDDSHRSGLNGVSSENSQQQHR